MSASATKLIPEFGPETQFDLRPESPRGPYRLEQETSFEHLKRRLLSERLAQVWEPDLNSAVRRAANEAAALAWVTPYPLFFFPSLFEEKTAEALAVAEHQAEVRLRSRELLAL